MTLEVLGGILAGVVLLWALLVGALWIAKPDDATIHESIRLLPDVVRLLTRISRDATCPRRVRFALVVLITYLAMPIDLVPDFLPVIGYADDAIIVALVLRWIVRNAGEPAVVRNWPGSDQGLVALLRLCRISSA